MTVKDLEGRQRIERLEEDVMRLMNIDCDTRIETLVDDVADLKKTQQSYASAGDENVTEIHLRLKKLEKLLDTHMKLGGFIELTVYESEERIEELEVKVERLGEKMEQGLIGSESYDVTARVDALDRRIDISDRKINDVMTEVQALKKVGCEKRSDEYHHVNMSKLKKWENDDMYDGTAYDMICMIENGKFD